MLFDDDEPQEEDFFDEDTPDEKPEPVEADLLKPPRQQSALIGHADVEARLLELIAANRLGQSLIFAGPSGVGKSTFAYRLAKYMFRYKNSEVEAGGLFGGFAAAPPPPADSLFVAETEAVAQQVASGGYPDLLIVEREVDEKGKTKVHDLDKVREITGFFRRTASHDGGWRIAVIDDADTMNRQSQNALLKILEEPPQKSLLILISHRLGAMLPTIMSRASVFHFKALPDAEVRIFLKRYADKLTQESEDRIILIAEGSIGRALYYAEAGRADAIDQAFTILDDWPKLDWTRIQLFADSIGSRGAEEGAQNAFRDALLWAVTSLAKTKSLGQPLPKSLESQGISRLLHENSLDGLLKICDRLRRHFDQVQIASLDKRFMVMGAYSAFADPQ